MEGRLAAQPFLAARLADPGRCRRATATVSAAPEGNVDLAPYPAVRAWLARVEALPGFVPLQKTPRRPGRLTMALPGRLTRRQSLPRRRTGRAGSAWASRERMRGVGQRADAHLHARAAPSAFRAAALRCWWARSIRPAGPGPRCWPAGPASSGRRMRGALAVACAPSAGRSAGAGPALRSAAGLLGHRAAHAAAQPRQRPSDAAGRRRASQLAVEQSIGNCPQYIQGRELQLGERAGRDAPRQAHAARARWPRWTGRARADRAAPTRLFVASAAPAGPRRRRSRRRCLASRRPAGLRAGRGRAHAAACPTSPATASS